MNQKCQCSPHKTSVSSTNSLLCCSETEHVSSDGEVVVSVVALEVLEVVKDVAAVAAVAETEAEAELVPLQQR